jgi:FeS assembly SUF system regulator
MLRMSKLTDYGTVVMTYLARHQDQVCTAPEIASSFFLGVPTVSKILKALAKAGLVVSYRGVKGGYTLARSAEEISVAQIIDALEGPISFTECSDVSGLCVQEPVCSIRGSWQRINHIIRDALERVTLAELAKPVSARPVSVRISSLRPSAGAAAE